MHGILWRFLPCAVNALTCGYNYRKPYCVSYPLIDWLCMAELTKEQIACEEKFLEGIPRWNIGALFLPPIWGPAHGFWATILFYPLWLVADNLFYAAYSERTSLAIAFAVIIGMEG